MGGSANLMVALKVGHNEKSRILTQSSWYFGNITHSWGYYFDKLHVDKKSCWFFIIGLFLDQSHFFAPLFKYFQAKQKAYQMKNEDHTNIVVKLGFWNYFLKNEET